MARNNVIFASRAYAFQRRLKIKITISRSKYDAYVYGLSLDTVAMRLRLLHTWQEAFEIYPTLVTLHFPERPAIPTAKKDVFYVKSWQPQVQLFP
jgi:hypothetical protein